jgi:pimeloyl-ACP methyl ester carboxylesterase
MVVTERLMPVNGIDVCVETFGEATDPAVLLIGGATSSMDWWDDEFCRRLAAGGRHVIRYDHRDTGRSTSFPAGHPPYSGVDLAHDALGVLDALGVHRAHLVGLSMGGALAQRIAVERPHRVLSLTLMSTSPGLGEDQGSGQTASDKQPAEPDELPDWTNRKDSVARIAETARSLGGAFTADEPQLRRLAERIFDRTRDMTAAQVNHFLVEPGGPPVRCRLGEITAPALILHGTQDTVFGPEHAQALAGEIPGARLIWLEGVGHEFPPAAVWPTVIDEILGQGARGRQPA